MKHLLLAAAAFVWAAPALADIDTTGSSAGNIQPFGAPDTATYGQTFTVAPGDTSLTSFSLFLNNRVDGADTLDLRGYLATWDGSKAGTLLYTSSTQTMNAAGTLQQFTFAPNVAVTAGQQYVAFLSISGLPAQPNNTFQMPNAGSVLAGGDFVFFNNGTDFGSLFTDDWSVFATDAWFVANFNAVPEPASWALMIGGFGLAGVSMRARRRAVAYA